MCEPRFGYAQRAARFQRRGTTLLARDDRLQVGLSAWEASELQIGDGTVTGQLELRSGQRAMLALLATEDAPLRVSERDAVERRLTDTEEVWRSWASRHSYEGPWRDALERSRLAIRLLADRYPGAIAAAGTTSLPELHASRGVLRSTEQVKPKDDSRSQPEFVEGATHRSLSEFRVVAKGG
jgi:hypothetical protein